MKIGQEMQTREMESKPIRANVSGKKSFNHLVQSQTHELKQQELKLLMKQISLQGDRLSRFNSIDNLVRFKRLVKGFLEETVYSGLNLHESHQFSQDGYSRKLSIVKEVDEKLIALTEEVINQEKEPVDLLGTIGEIKGLLVNLYM